MDCSLGYTQQTGGGENVRPKTNLRYKAIPTNVDSVKLDSLTIIPGSLILENKELSEIISLDSYRLDSAGNTLIWIHKPNVDSVEATYRIFPYDFHATFFHRDINKLIDEEGKYFEPYTDFFDGNQPLTDFGNLSWNGSIARGISFGNSQDVVVNSQLNLQISGMLTDDIEVVAAITDENIPFQPQGNTQQLQEFDRVFIQLNRNQTSVTFGDIYSRAEKSYFMRFNKKAQGATFSNLGIINDKTGLFTSATISIAKGKFAKNTFDGQEGNQGPFRLTGLNGETFIIILAGTEKVFIDGKEMKRGTEYDYVIDYNMGEVTFTPNKLITKDSRIAIEFEYSEQNYLRTVSHVRTEIRKENITWKLNVYSEQDHKNQPVQLTLDSDEKNLLSGIGDKLQLASLPSIDSLAFDPLRIQYKLVDTTVNSTFYDSVFVYSTSKDSAYYVLNFTQVGAGNGNYILAQSEANGKVYMWVAPVNGILQGSYEPVVLLVTPKKTQLVTFGADYKISKVSNTSFEVALSNKDLNTFSTIDAGDDVGFAGKANYSRGVKLGKAEKGNPVLRTKAGYEYVNRNFNPLERFRSVEFERDWNLGESSVDEDDHIGSASIGILKPKMGSIDYSFSTFIKGKDYNGFNHRVNGSYNKNGFRIAGGGSVLNTTGSINESRFIRPKIDLSQKLPILKGLRLGVRGEQENNQIHKTNNDTLLASSFRFDELGAYLVTGDSSKNNVSIDFRQRMDYLPLDGNLRLSSIGRTLSFINQISTNNNSQLKWNITYRDLNTIYLVDTSVGDKGKTNSIIGRAEYFGVILKGFIRTNTFYQIDREREQKRQYAYLEVLPGEGQYTWHDYNNDSIQTLDEFDLAQFADSANFRKILIPTNEYQNTFAVHLTQSLNIEPKAIWYSKKGFKKFISRFASFSTLQINKKSLEDGNSLPINPFDLDVLDSSLITLTAIGRSSLFFNRNSGKFGVEINWINSKNKVLLVNGFDSRTRDEQNLKLRWNLGKSVTSRFNAKVGNKINKSGFFTNKDYNLVYSEYSPKITYLFKTALRVSLSYEYQDKKNTQKYESEGLGGETLYSHLLSVDMRYVIVSKSSINIRASLVNINFSPEAQKNTSVAYVMLEGLQPGSNGLWFLTWDKKLENNMQITLNYEGRKSASAKAVHLGRAQVRYIF
ncbi:MAG: hypothetical protein IIA45_02835 [Bacteroidetes bacterium]|nr:hypothetical protein [Bacteroidota bacterium]